MATRLRYDYVEQSGFIEILCDPALASVAMRLRLVASGGAERVFDVPEVADFNGRLYFNSYYLEDGPWRLSVETRTAGSRGWRVVFDHLIRVQNGTSDLSATLRRCFQARPDQAVLLNQLDASYFSWLPGDVAVDNYPRAHRAGRQALRSLPMEQVESFDQQGFLRLPAFFDAALVQKASAFLEQVSRRESHGFRRGSSDRIVNLHTSNLALKEIFSSSRLYDVVSDLFGYQACPCQSLTFINGSTQDAHQDTIHLTPFPRGMMCGIWIALEDVKPGSGELFYYPRSHQLPAVLCSSHAVPKVDPDVGDYSAFGRVFTPAVEALLHDNPTLHASRFMAKAGDVLIWQENLIHGGAPRTEVEQTRMSMVIHAFAEPALVYYDSTGMSGRRQATPA